MQYHDFITRRWFFKECSVGLGTIALHALLHDRAGAASEGNSPAATADHMAPRRPHFPAKATNVIFLFMAGGPSHLELFDNKPTLARYDGRLPPPELLEGYRAAFIRPDATCLGPKFRFARHGRSGIELSELLSNLAGCADDIAIDARLAEAARAEPDHHARHPAVAHDQIGADADDVNGKLARQTLEEIRQIVLVGGREQHLRRPADPKPGQFGERLVRQQPPAQVRHRGFEIGRDVGESSHSIPAPSIRRAVRRPIG